jgi:acylaminoacyl-peptidase
VSLQRDGTVHQLTKLNEALSARVGGFSRAEPFWVKASTDGEPIQAWVMRSAAVTKGERGPIIMDIHGGPYAQCGDRFSIKYQLFLAAGYSVVYANPRGSTGYGEMFGNLAHNAWPGHDGTDLLDVLEAVKNRDFVDPNRVFVTGTSGGGTMSLWILAHSAHVQAAVSVKPLTDWISWTFTSDLGFQIYRHWMGNKLPWPKVDDYWNRSVLSLVPLIHAPVLLISGDDDRRAPPDQALEMFTALSLCGSPVALIRGPNVTHNSSDYRPSMFLQEAASTIGWFSESTTNPPPLPANRRCHM